MRINIWKPNSSSTGHACSFSFNETGALYISFIKQASYNAATRSGSFSENVGVPEKNLNCKFSVFECGEMLAAFADYREAKFYHKFDKTEVSIKLTPWVKNQKDIDLAFEQGKPTPLPIKAYGISATRNGTDTFKLPLEASEIMVISELLKYAILTNMRANSQKQLDGGEKRVEDSPSSQ